MKRFLVTGGAGFIGSHIVEALVKNGSHVRVLDNFSSGKLHNLEKVSGRIEVVTGDIRDQAVCLKAAIGVDAILHQAALRSVPKSMVNPWEYNQVNIDGTLNMLQAAKENKVKRFVFASSSSVYGDVVNFPEKESFLPQLISPYALSKLAGEHYCKIFAYHYGMKTVSLRYFNVFGPRQAVDDEYAVVIPKFITCMLKDKRPPIFGTGKQSRDFTFVSNVVDANLSAAKADLRGGNIFNVASGKNYSILDLVKILNNILGKDIRPVLLSKRAGDVFKTLADISGTKRHLGFKPKVNFIQGLNLTVKYFKNYG